MTRATGRALDTVRRVRAGREEKKVRQLPVPSHPCAVVRSRTVTPTGRAFSAHTIGNGRSRGTRCSANDGRRAKSLRPGPVRRRTVTRPSTNHRLSTRSRCAAHTLHPPVEHRVNRVRRCGTTRERGRAQSRTRCCGPAHVFRTASPSRCERFENEPLRASQVLRSIVSPDTQLLPWTRARAHISTSLPVAPKSVRHGRRTGGL